VTARHRHAIVTEEALRIRFTRHGGFTGIPLNVTVDTDSLSTEQIATLRRLLEDAKFFELPATAGSRGADQFQYRIAVEAGSRRHQIEVGDQSMPDSLEPLIEFLTDLGRPSRSA